MLFGKGSILCIMFTCLHCLICVQIHNTIHHGKRFTKSKLKGKIVNGESVPIESYPFAVQFLNTGRLCGGVILNSFTVTTSAHCLVVNSDTEKMKIYTGAKYAYDFNAVRYNVLTFVMHEDYNKKQAFSYDIALVFPEKYIVFGYRVQRAILVNHDKWMDEREDNFTVTGWGYTQEDGEISKVGLQRASLKYVTPQECSKLHNDYRLTADMFCLYGEGKRDVCQGDSGGSVIWNNMVVGLTSHGNGCARLGKPSVYTNIWFLRNWIESHITKFSKEYCKNKSKDNDKFITKKGLDTLMVFK